MDPSAAAVAIDILTDPRARADGFGDDLRALFDEIFGLKTGTSTGWHDAWAAVFTDRLTVVVWLGDPGRRPMGAVSGFDGAARPAVTILAAATRRADALRLAGPGLELPALVSARVCVQTGLLAGDRCAHTVEERFVEGTLPTRRCAAHLDDGTWVVPRAYARWVGQAHPAGVALADSSAATPGAELRVVHPAAGARWLLDARRGATLVPLRAELDGAAPPGTTWEVDGAPLASDRWPASPGRHRFVAICQGRRSDPVEVEVVASSPSPPGEG
jgi:penicillin-binding protein 1C